MKNLFILVFVAFLALSIISVQAISLSGETDIQIQSDTYSSSDGERAQVEQDSSGEATISSGNIFASVDLKINSNSSDGKLFVILSNGNSAEVKVMPQEASVRASSSLEINSCNAENNCTMELKESNKGNAIIVYEAKAKKNVKVLGFIKSKMTTTAQVDAQTGTVVSVQKPWWSFAASAQSSSSVNASG